jgi:hypothetical protein
VIPSIIIKIIVFVAALVCEQPFRMRDQTHDRQAADFFGQFSFSAFRILGHVQIF